MLPKLFRRKRKGDLRVKMNKKKKEKIEIGLCITFVVLFIIGIFSALVSIFEVDTLTMSGKTASIIIVIIYLILEIIYIYNNESICGDEGKRIHSFPVFIGDNLLLLVFSLFGFASVHGYYFLYTKIENIFGGMLGFIQSAGTFFVNVGNFLVQYSTTIFIIGLILAIKYGLYNKFIRGRYKK